MRGRSGPARFTFDPQPVLGAVVMGGEDDDMFAHLLGDPSFDLLARGMVGNLIAGLGEILVGDHAALVGYGLEGVGAVFNGNFGVGAAVIPAKLLGKEGAQIEVIQVLFDLGAVENGGHGQSSSGPMRPSEQMIRGSRRSCSP